MYLSGLAKYLLKLVFCPFIFISLWRKRGDERIIERERLDREKYEAKSVVKGT